MRVTIWHSSEDFARYINHHTNIKNYAPIFRRLFESDANNPTNFHTLPDHIKQILYLDAPDLIVEVDSEPIFSIEISTEAGTGHNSFQRFARLAASVENGVPALYIYPEAAIISRKATKSAPASTTWDRINPAIFAALEHTMSIHGIPALFFYHPSDYRSHPTNPTLSPNYRNGAKGLRRDATFISSPEASDSEMQRLFLIINDILSTVQKSTPLKARSQLQALPSIRNRRLWMQGEFHSRMTGRALSQLSPLTRTTLVDTRCLVDFISKFHSGSYAVGNLIKSRPQSLIFHPNASFRGDPYPGVLAAIDYMQARTGKTFEERQYNLVLAWGSLSQNDDDHSINLTGSASINDIVSQVQNSERLRNILSRDYRSLTDNDIPRYYMQMRYGSTFSKNKHVRVYSYFADAIIFPDGALWRDG